MRKQYLIVLLMIVSLFSMTSFNLVVNITPVKAAGEEITIGYSEYNPGNSYRIRLTKLEVSTEYQLGFTVGCADNITITTGADETQTAPRVTLEAPTTGDQCIILLVTSAANMTVLSQVRLYVADIGDLINEEGLIEVIMALVVIAFLLTIFMGLLFKKRPN